MPVTESALLNGVNDEQRKVVTQTQGPSLIIAGAGSGKTRALTHRIAYLMEQGVKPWQILAVTFTNKAAKEMKERIGNLLEIEEEKNVNPFSFGSGKMPTSGTFHSICARILRREIEHIGMDSHFVIYDTEDQRKLVKEILKEMHIDDKELKPRAVLSYISRFKSEALLPTEAESQASDSHMKQVVAVYKKYQHALKQSNALDFDDLILETVRLFNECPNVLNKYQETWRYIHVDEYQDTNHSQYLFISLLAQKYRNLCVIGDPDQSIYSFRGADIRNIMEFEKEYPDALKITLEQNYRSHQLILDAADAVISVNPDRPKKSMWSEKKEGALPILNEVENEKKEASEAIKAVQEFHRKHGHFKNQVILYRTNAQSRLFEEACLRSGIPYRIVGGVKFYARREVKDVLAYLQVLLNPNDALSLLRIINVPARKIGLTTIGKLQEYSSINKISLWKTLHDVEEIQSINQPTKERLSSFIEILDKLKIQSEKVTVLELANSLLEKIGMESWLRDETEEGEERWRNVQELLSVMQKYNGLDPLISLTSFLEEVSLISEVDSLNEGLDDALTLMTLHLCKGLEFNHVIIAGCEEGIFPHSNCMLNKEQLEEERRLMYVGMTRGKMELHMLYARTRMLWGQTQSNEPSRFIYDIPDSLIERRSDNVLSAFAWASDSGFKKAKQGKDIEPFRQKAHIDAEFNQDMDFDDDINQDSEAELAAGMRIRHPSFGLGIIKSIRGDIAEIQFDSGESKTLALSIAPIERV